MTPADHPGAEDPAGPDEPRVEYELRVWCDGNIVESGRLPLSDVAAQLRRHADALAPPPGPTAGPQPVYVRLIEPGQGVHSHTRAITDDVNLNYTRTDKDWTECSGVEVLGAVSVEVDGRQVWPAAGPTAVVVDPDEPCTIGVVAKILRRSDRVAEENERLRTELEKYRRLFRPDPGPGPVDTPESIEARLAELRWTVAAPAAPPPGPTAEEWCESWGDACPECGTEVVHTGSKVWCERCADSWFVAAPAPAEPPAADLV